MSKTPETSKKQLTPEEEVKKYLAEKLARAKEMGFDTSTPLYHGTDTTFKEFMPSDAGSYGPGVYTSTDPKYASEYAFKNRDGSSLTKKEKTTLAPRVLPLYTKNIFDYSNPEHRRLLPKELQKSSFNLNSSDYEGELLANEVKKLGFDSLKANDTVVVFDPKNIRSKFAKFDPAMSESSDISSLTSNPSSLKNKLLNKAFKAADVIGMGSDVYKGNVADALVSAAEMSAPKLGTAASRFAPLLELLRPTEMETEDNITSDVPGAHSRKFKKLKSLFEKK